MDLDRYGRQELTYRALDGDCDGIRERLAAGDDPNLADRRGFTPLHAAAQQAHAEAVRLLLDAGAFPDPVDRDGNTPLWPAMLYNVPGRIATITALLHGGADPDFSTRSGVTLREMAHEMGFPDVIAVFDSAG